MPKRKRITMTVTVSAPHWLTAAQARKEVRSLINDQAHYGHFNHEDPWDDVDETSFRAVSVKAQQTRPD